MTSQVRKRFHAQQPGLVGELHFRHVPRHLLLLHRQREEGIFASPSLAADDGGEEDEGGQRIILDGGGGKPFQNICQTSSAFLCLM